VRSILGRHCSAGLISGGFEPRTEFGLAAAIEARTAEVCEPSLNLDDRISFIGQFCLLTQGPEGRRTTSYEGCYGPRQLVRYCVQSIIRNTLKHASSAKRWSMDNALWQPVIRRLAVFWTNCSFSMFEGLQFGNQMAHA
jgi:hypothetical protein